jgi:hypothetical protein
MIGCTDIRVDFKQENAVDSLEVLAGKIIERTSSFKYTDARN